MLKAKLNISPLNPYNKRKEDEEYANNGDHAISLIMDLIQLKQGGLIKRVVLKSQYYLYILRWFIYVHLSIKQNNLNYKW